MSSSSGSSQDPYGSQQPGDGYGAAPPPDYYGSGGNPPTPPPSNHLVWAIISLFLCLPLGIPAIIFAMQVNSKWSMGDAQGAEDASRKAKQFALWATILGVLWAVLWVVLTLAGIFALPAYQTGQPGTVTG